jgi:3-methylcrotonyl-CoA carboxylase alpha subunit
MIKLDCCESWSKVKKGQTLLIVEAMKMEHVIKAPFEGIVKSIHYSLNDIVPEKKKLISIEKSE